MPSFCIACVRMGNITTIQSLGGRRHGHGMVAWHCHENERILCISMSDQYICGCRYAFWTTSLNFCAPYDFSFDDEVYGNKLRLDENHISKILCIACRSYSTPSALLLCTNIAADRPAIASPPQRELDDFVIISHRIHKAVMAPWRTPTTHLKSTGYRVYKIKYG